VKRTLHLQLRDLNVDQLDNRRRSLVSLSLSLRKKMKMRRMRMRMMMKTRMLVEHS
jgi:hypothetical protein